MIIGMLFVSLAVLCESGLKKIPSSIGITVLFASVTVMVTYIYVKRSIKSGYYFSRKLIVNEKIIAFLSSTIGLTICIIIFQFIKNTFTSLGYMILSVVLVAVSSALSLIYFLKLKYAKKYGLEECLPTRCSSNQYTELRG